MTKGAFWISIDKFFTQAVQFIIGILIARIIDPQEFGILGLLLIFVNLSNVIVDSGFGSSLIQKNNPSSTDYSTVFYFNILFSITFYTIIWFLSPSISKFFNIPDLTELLRTISVVILFNAFAIVPLSILSINLDFKSLSIVNFISTIISGLVGLILAYKGLGIWALIYQSLLRSFIFPSLLFLRTRWKPSIFISFLSLKSLYKYGINIFSSAFISSLINEINSFVIGKFYKPSTLGFYTRGVQFANMPYYTISSIINGVLFPSLSSIKTDNIQLVNISKQAIKVSAIVSFPIMLWIVMIAEPIVSLLLTDKWLPAVPIVRIVCIARMISIVAGVNVIMINAIGRSDLSLKQDIIKIIIRLCLLLSALSYGIIWIALAELFATVIHFFINGYYPGKFLKYGALEQIKSLWPIFIAALISSTSGFLMMTFFSDTRIKIFTALLLSIATYTMILYITDKNSFKLIQRTILKLT